MDHLPAQSSWHTAQGLRTLSYHSAELRKNLAGAIERTYEELTALIEQLPDEALAEYATGQPGAFRYLDLTPFLPAQPSALQPAFVRSATYSGLALLTAHHGIVVTEEKRSRYDPRILAHIDELDGPALYEALKPWLPLPEAPTAHGGAQCPEP